MEKRIEKRLLHPLELIYGDNDTFSPGLARNISSHGILIQAEYQLFPINREVKVILTIGNESVSIQGIVCWNSEYTSTETPPEKQLGLFIPDPPSAYVNFINQLN
ncbi:MAG: PilZ domain-containing protein [Candidatus Aminicenantes bacterium]|nr:PilZ domain-containing protein [Candidatus Aminicenantes bacterium]